MAADPGDLVRPKVIANFALTWDGRISTRQRSASDFSSPKDKRRLLEIRAEGDAVIASATTVAADTMTMGLPDLGLRQERVRRGQSEYPIRVLVSGRGEVDPELRVFKERCSPIVIYTTDCMSEFKRTELGQSAVVRVEKGTRVNLGAMLKSLVRDFGVRTVVCEGGGNLFAGLLREGCVDELCLTFCPHVFGGNLGVTLTGLVGDWLFPSIKVRLLEFESIGGECFTRWAVAVAKNRKIQLRNVR